GPLGGAHVGARPTGRPSCGVLRAGGLLARGVPCGLRVGLPVGHRRLLVSAGLVVGPAAPRLGPLTDADAARIVAAVVLAEADVAASSRRPLRTGVPGPVVVVIGDRKSTRLNSSHVSISYA